MIHSPKCGRMSGFEVVDGRAAVGRRASTAARARCGRPRQRRRPRVAARGSRPRPCASAGTPVSGSPASGRALSAMYQHTSWAQSDGTSGKRRPHERDDEKRPSTSSERRKSATRGATTTCGKSVVHRVSPSGLKRMEKSTAMKTATTRAQAAAAERGLGAHTRAPPFFGGGSVDMRVDRVSVEVNGSGIAANRGQPRSSHRGCAGDEPQLHNRRSRVEQRDRVRMLALLTLVSPCVWCCALQVGVGHRRRQRRLEHRRRHRRAVRPAR